MLEVLGLPMGSSDLSPKEEISLEKEFGDCKIAKICPLSDEAGPGYT
jgi:hypothetical protein